MACGCAAALAFTAALLHVFNHSLFKNLLFLGSGAVLTATGERNMEHLGGLIHRMPLTAFTFLVGCVAISALPPLNGFVSEWLTFQAILHSPQLPSWGLKFLMPAVGALLALSAALAAACFVKAFGITFLGRPRTEAARRAHEADRFSLAAMFSPRRALPLAGILPGFSSTRWPRCQVHGRRQHAVQRDVPFLSIVPIAESRSSYNGLLVFLFMVFSGDAAAVASTSSPPTVCGARPAWDCGYPDPSTAHAIFRLELRPADPPRVRHARLSRQRTGRHAAARRSAAGASRRAAQRSRSGMRSMRPSRAPSHSSPTG